MINTDDAEKVSKLIDSIAYLIERLESFPKEVILGAYLVIGMLVAYFFMRLILEFFDNRRQINIIDKCNLVIGQCTEALREVKVALRENRS